MNLLMGPTTRDVPNGGVGRRRTPNVFKFARKLVRRQPCCKRVGNSIFCDFFLVTIVGEFVKTPPPRTEGVSVHHCLPLGYDINRRYVITTLYCTNFSKKQLTSLWVIRSPHLFDNKHKERHLHTVISDNALNKMAVCLTFKSHSLLNSSCFHNYMSIT